MHCKISGLKLTVASWHQDACLKLMLIISFNFQYEGYSHMKSVKCEPLIIAT